MEGPVAETARAGRWQRPLPTRGEWLGVALLFALALGLRLLHLEELRANDPFFERPALDARLYHEWAVRASAGDWLGEGVLHHAPLYPSVLGVLYAVFGPSLWLAKALNAVLGALSCVGVWWLARGLFDRRAAFLAGSMVALYEMLIFYGGTLVLANLQVPLLVGLLIATTACLERPGLGRWLGAGVLLGLASLTRPNLLLFGALITPWLPVALRAWPPSRRGVWTAAFVAGAALAIAPVTLRNIAVGGDFVLITDSAGFNLFLGNNPEADGTFRVPRMFPRSFVDDPWEQGVVFTSFAERASGRSLRPSEVSRFWAGQAIDYVREHPGDWLRLLARKLALFVNAFEVWNIRSVTLSRDFSWVLRLPLLGFGALAPLALLGIVLTWRDARRLVPLYALIATFLFSSLLFFATSRYRVPVVPALAVLAGAALTQVYDRIRARRFALLATALAAAALFAWPVHRQVVREDLSVAYFNLGNRYKALEQWDRAIAAYRTAIQRNPSYLPAYNNLAITYERTGENDADAIRVWRWILESAERRGLERYIERARRHLRALQDPGTE